MKPSREHKERTLAPSEVLVHDEPEACPYLEGRVARLPLRWQRGAVVGDAFDLALEVGDRRVGRMLYRTTCAACSACEPLRVPATTFSPSRSQRRVWRRNQDLAVEVGPARLTDEKLALFNRHKMERGLSRDGAPMSAESYTNWFVRTCTTTVEMLYRAGERLIGVGIVDLGARDSSSVYFFFDPDASDRSLGTFSVLFETLWLRSNGGRYHYLGLYAEGSPHIAYKARFFPHERRIDGVWQPFARGGPELG